MKRILLAALVGVLVNGPALGKTYTSLMSGDCKDFTAFYAKSGLTWKNENEFPSWTNTQFAIRLFSIFGYLTYANRNVLPSGDFLRDKGMTLHEAISWIGSYCRDHPSESLTDAIDALLEK